MGWPGVKAKAVWAREWKSKKKRGGGGQGVGERRGEHANERIRGTSHSDVV